MQRKILVAQGGGPTAVINQSLAGVALEARWFADVTRDARIFIEFGPNKCNLAFLRWKGNGISLVEWR